MSGDPVPVRRRRRAGRRTRQRQDRRRRRRILVALGVVVGALAIVGGTLVRDVLTVRGALIDAQADLGGLLGAVETRDVSGAAAATAAASDDLARAEAVLATRRIRLFAAVPVVGEPAALVRDIVGTARTALDVGDVLLAPSVVDGLDVRVRDGQIDLTPVVALADAFQRAPIDELALRVAALEAADLTLAPSALTQVHGMLLERARPVVDALVVGRDVVHGLPVLLGADGPREHLVALQTSAELRATGGLIGVLAVLEADDGRLRLGAPVAFDPIEAEREAAAAPGATDPDADDDTAPPDPILQALPAGSGAQVDLPADFAARYAHNGPTRVLSNVNVDPDLPTTGEVLLDLYEARTGVRLDGVVLLDPVALGAVMVALDAPLRLPAALIAGTDAPATIAPGELARFVLIDLYEHFGEGRGPQRAAVQTALATQALEALFGRSWDGPRVAGALADAAGGRHVQVHARDREVTDAFAGLAVSGRLADALADPLRDVVAVTVNNAVGGKQDVHVTHATRLRVHLGPPVGSEELRRLTRDDGTVRLVRPVTRRIEVRQDVVNPLTAGAFDRYVTGNCLTGPGQGCFLGPEGDHRAWLSVWLDAGDRVVAVRDADGFPPVRTGTFHGVSVVDAVLDVPSETSRHVEVVADGRVDVEVRGEDTFVYRLGWWRQAKAVPDLLTATVVAPEGWRVEGVRVDGGDVRLPLFGEGGMVSSGPLTVGRRLDGIVVTGAVGSDVDVEVVLGRTD